MRLRLVIAYDGRPYAGWQSQVSGNTVQDLLQEAFWKVSGRKVAVHGAGRTDAGVHALGQCAHVDVFGKMSPADWQRALNSRLPPMIRIVKCRRAASDFHARFCAKAKVYRYLIRNGPVLPPHEFGRAWHLPGPLDIAALRQAAATFTGHHDFAAFSAQGGKSVLETKRTIRRITISRRAGLLALTFEGDGFLYKMVRMLTTAMVRVGNGRISLEALERRLKAASPKWNLVAPAEGLYLVRVVY